MPEDFGAAESPPVYVHFTRSARCRRDIADPKSAGDCQAPRGRTVQKKLQKKAALLEKTEKVSEASLPSSSTSVTEIEYFFMGLYQSLDGIVYAADPVKAVHFYEKAYQNNKYPPSALALARLHESGVDMAGN